MDSILYYGGPILTMNKRTPRAEALLTQNGRIVAVGKYEDLKHESAAPFHLQGRTLMPGFVDGHSHAMGYGIDVVTKCDLSGSTSFDEILSRIRKYREEKNLTHKESICCRGYDLAILKEGRHPDAAVLDALGFDNPICCIHQSGHMATFNTAAMKKAGVLDGNYVCPEGGFAGRDENGALTGYFEEQARTTALTNVFKSLDPEADMRRGMLLAQERYIQNGFTTIQEGSGNGEAKFNVLGALADEGLLKIDVVAYMSAKMSDREIRAELIERFGRAYARHLKIGGSKLFLDGSPQARTAWLSAPYEGEREYCGYPLLSDEVVRLQIGAALDEGVQIMAHCNGDAACEQFISAFEAEADARGLLGRDLRPVMIHAQTVRQDQLARMKGIGMMASFFIGHCYYWGDTHLANLGQRGTRISPAGYARSLGVPFSFHQDSPVTPPDMLHSIWCAVNRISASGVTVGAENRINVYDALIAATRGGAYTYFEEDTKGILQAGAVADFVILDRDPTSVDPMELRNLRVLSTIKEDKILYEA